MPLPSILRGRLRALENAYTYNPLGRDYAVFKLRVGVNPSTAPIPSMDMVGYLPLVTLRLPQKILMIDLPPSIGTESAGLWITPSWNGVYTVVIIAVRFVPIHLKIPRNAKFCSLMFCDRVLQSRLVSTSNPPTSASPVLGWHPSATTPSWEFGSWHIFLMRRLFWKQMW